MKRRDFLQSMAYTSLLSQLGLNSAIVNATEPQPNIVLILADDMGFSDLGCFGGEINTPNIDSLANNGTRFTNFYNCARCCPTRASLLTGLYPHQVGLTRNGQSLTHDGATIAELLKSAHYNTAMSGKWHLSRTQPLDDHEHHQAWLDHQYEPNQPFAPVDTYPTNRGFDHYYGNIWGVVNYFDPFSLVEGTEPIDAVPDDYYITDAITDKSVEYIQNFSESENPFFLYVAHCAPHWPLHALNEDIEKYRGVYEGGWNELRQKRYERMLQLGLFDEKNTPLPPVQEGDISWEELSDDEKHYQSEKMAIHAAMVDRMDQGIGKIVDALKKTGQYDNTIIIFLSDNGASPEMMYEAGYDRTSETRGGEKVLYPNDIDPSNDNQIDQLGSETTYTCIGQAWASACNTPFRYWKAQSFEGGCHTPMIVHWPKQQQAGNINHQMGHVMDIMPTCLDLAGAEYPDQYQGHDILPLEGKSLIPVINGKQRDGYNKLFFEHEGGRAIRNGDWKLVANKHRSNQWELYNLAQDQTETNNLAANHPERVKQMTDDWQAWATKVGLME